MAALWVVLHPKLLRSVASQLPSNWCAPPRSHISSPWPHLVFCDYSTVANNHHGAHDTGEGNSSLSLYWLGISFKVMLTQTGEETQVRQRRRRHRVCARTEPTNSKPKKKKKKTFLLFFFLLQMHVEKEKKNIGRSRALTMLRPPPAYLGLRLWSPC